MLIHYYDLTAGVKKGASRLLQSEERRGGGCSGLVLWSGLVFGKKEDFCTCDVANCAWKNRVADLTPAVFAPQH